jgi:hypothetical protein
MLSPSTSTERSLVVTTSLRRALRRRFPLMLPTAEPEARNHRPNQCYIIGFTRGRERLIYGSFFPPHVAAAPRPSSAPVVICDGGPLFWGIVYNLTSRRFEEPEFNGP